MDDAFAKMMAVSKRQPRIPTLTRNIIAIGYEWRFNRSTVSHDDPLFDVAYFGIAVRTGYASPTTLLNQRTKEHRKEAKTVPSELGLHAVLESQGFESFTVNLLEFREGTDGAALTKWANEWEIATIDANGGMLRDFEPSAPIRQTLNLTRGGKGDPTVVWHSVQVRAVASWKKFQRQLDKHIAATGIAQAANGFIDKDGYPLAIRIACVRHGRMLLGKPDEAERRAYLNSKPGWVWSTTKKMSRALWSDEQVEANKKRCFDTHVGNPRFHESMLRVGKEKSKNADLAALERLNPEEYAEYTHSKLVLSKGDAKKRADVALLRSTFAPRATHATLPTLRHLLPDAEDVSSVVDALLTAVETNSTAVVVPPRPPARGSQQTPAQLRRNLKWRQKVKRDLDALRETTHPDAKQYQVKRLRDSGAVDNAIQMQVSKVVDSIIDVIERN